MPYGTGDLTSSTDSVVVLFKGGRLQTWHRLTDAQRDDYSAQHVELMLGVAHEHGMTSLEGFKLLEPKQPWERFWVLEFPTLEGAEAWIEAEMAPPYGTYGYYEYHLARRFAEDYFNDWVTTPRSESESLGPVDPSNLPPLDVDRDSYVVLEFARMLPEAVLASEGQRGDPEHRELMKSVAQEHGLIRLEAFQLMAPQPDWHRAYVIELPTIDAAEAWMAAEMAPPQSAYSNKTMHLSRRWSPRFFAGWLQGNDR